MKSRFFSGVVSGREDGAVLIFVVLAIALMFVGLTALAIDTGHMVLVRNELQNSADASSLAGAGVLINPSDGTINTGALTEAEDVARENPAAGADRTSGSTATDKLDVVVKIGHWSFAGSFDGVTVAENRFHETTNYTQLANWETYSYGLLNSYDGQGGRPLFINAVQVTTSRERTGAIFANFFGQDDHKILTDAVAYIGFAASVPPETVDIPYAVCQQSITENGALSCGVARASSEQVETGGWTNFSQDLENDTCGDSVDASDMHTILDPIPPCEDLNTNPLVFGKYVSTNNGAIANSFSDILEHCFVENGATAGDWYQNASKYGATKPWVDVTLPVVDCPDGTFQQSCTQKVLGVVTVDIMWMSYGKDNVPVEYHYNNTDWNCSDPTDNELCWQDFQDAFGWLFDDPEGDGLPEIKGIYFGPNCNYTEPVGGVGSDNFGVMAKVPVLVE